MKFSFDPDADALYIRLQEGPAASTIVFDDGLVTDLDAVGSPVGYEFLNVRANGILKHLLPGDVQKGLVSVIANGLLQSNDYKTLESEL